MTQAIISRNPQAEFHNEVELVETFDFTYSVRALKAMLMVAKQIKADSRPTDRELIMAECALQIGESLRLNDAQ